MSHLLLFLVRLKLEKTHICRIILAKLVDNIAETWIYRMEYQDAEDYETYIASMYFVLTTFTTVGFGDITAFTVYER